MAEILISWAEGPIGTPVPVEIFNESLVRVGEPVVEISNVDHLVKVPAPGLYLIRGELPDGKRMSGTVEVRAGQVSRLILRNESRSRHDQNFDLQTISHDRNEMLESFKMTGPFRAVRATGSSFDAPVFLPFSDAEVQGPKFRVYNDEKPGDTGAQLVQYSFSVKRRSPPSASRDWFPLYLRCRWVPSSQKFSAREWLLALPPSADVRVVIDLPGAYERSGDSIKTSISSFQPSVDALLGYLFQGASGSARRIAAAVEKQAIESLEGKLSNPIAAIVTGYFKLIMGNPARPSSRWLKRLADDYENLPDTAVIYGASLLRGSYELGNYTLARSYLIEAANRGIPMYTMGLRLLFDSLRRLAIDGMQDVELQNAIAKVRLVAAYADWEGGNTAFTALPEQSRSRRSVTTKVSERILASYNSSDRRRADSAG